MLISSLKISKMLDFNIFKNFENFKKFETSKKLISKISKLLITFHLFMKSLKELRNFAINIS